MNKDDILKMSREENKIADEREMHVRLKAGKIAKAVGIAIAFILVLVDNVWLDMPVIVWTALTIAFGMNAIEDWIVVATIKKQTEWVTVLFDTAMLICSIAMFIKVV